MTAPSFFIPALLLALLSGSFWIYLQYKMYIDILDRRFDKFEDWQFFILLFCLAFSLFSFEAYNTQALLNSTYFNAFINRDAILLEPLRHSTTLFFIAGAFVLSALAIIFYKWGKPTIFISYNNENLSEVKQIVSSNLNKAFTFKYIPFSETDPNDLIARVQKLLKSADIVFVLPSERQQSNFTDAEVLTALQTNKMVFLISLPKQQHLPNTAYSFLPAIDYERFFSINAKKDILYFVNYSALQKLLLYLNWNRRSIHDLFYIIILFVVAVALALIQLLVYRYNVFNLSEESQFYLGFGLYLIVCISVLDTAALLIKRASHIRKIKKYLFLNFSSYNKTIIERFRSKALKSLKIIDVYPDQIFTNAKFKRNY